jgi:long-chain acyl-CoA synthetase
MQDVVHRENAPGGLRARTVPGLIAERVRRTPGGAAWCIAAADGAWTTVQWAEYARQVDTVARALAVLGIRTGDRVAIMAPVSLKWEIADKALLSIGAIVVGVDLHASREDRDFILADAGATACIVPTAAALHDLAPDTVGRLRFIITLEETAGSGDGRVHAWDDLYRGTHDSAVSAVPRDDDVATLIYTSGTTGKPKAITYTHRQLTLACQALLEAFAPITPLDRGVCWLPLSNMFQRVMNLCSIGAGSRTYFIEDPRQLMDRLPGIAPTILISVPRLYEKIYKSAQERLDAAPRWQRHLLEFALRLGARVADHRRAGTQPDLPLAAAHRILDTLVLRRIRDPFGGRMRFMVSGSAPLSPSVMRFFEAAGLLILEAYGLSENIVPVAANRPGAHRSGSVGTPLPANDVRLAADGEVMVRGPGLFSGYENAPAASARVDAEGFFATGDLGEFDADGFLYLRGRKNDIIKTSTGRRIAPSRIEHLLRDVPAVDQALVIGDGREVLVAILALDPAQPHEQRETAACVQRVNESLAEYERIRGLLLIPQGLSIASGQLTSNLKPRRGAIAAQHRDQLDRLYAELRRPEARAGIPVVVS